MRCLAGSLLTLLVASLAPPAAAGTAAAPEIPLPEHPRPDLERAEWVNLNGPWSFRFDPADAGPRRPPAAVVARRPLPVRRDPVADRGGG